MSNDARQPEDNQNEQQGVRETNSESAKLPARRDQTGPAGRGELSEADREHIKQLFDRANGAHGLAVKAARDLCQHMLDAGAALLEAKALCPKGMWQEWLAAHFKASARTAQRYMHLAKLVPPIGEKTTSVSFFHPEELASSLSAALRKIERQQRATTDASSETRNIPAAADVLVDIPQSAAAYLAAPPAKDDNSLAKIMSLFDELDASLRRAIQSGEWLDYGQFVLDELERIRADLEACRLLINDGCTASRRSA